MMHADSPAPAAPLDRDHGQEGARDHALNSVTYAPSGQMAEFRSKPYQTREEDDENYEGGEEDDEATPIFQRIKSRESKTSHQLGENATTSHAMAGSYQAPGVLSMGNDRPVVVPGSDGKPPDNWVSGQALDEVRNDERSLWRDNNIIPPKHPRPRTSNSVLSSLIRAVGFKSDSSTPPRPDDRGELRANGLHPRETTPLLMDPDANVDRRPYGGQDSPTIIDAKWEEAVVAGTIQTSYRREAKVLARYSRPLVFTFLLQYSLPVASVFALGHWGAVELSGVSLGSMTVNVTGCAIYQGLATSLDTLCAQAYGSGRKQLVGLHTQRMIFFLWVITIPIGALWLNAEPILSKIIPDPQVASLAALYIRVVLLGAPGLAAFEAGKRFVQAQGLFAATFYVLLLAAPLNAF